MFPLPITLAANSGYPPISTVVLVIIAAIILSSLKFFYMAWRAWLKARAGHVHVSYLQMFFMSLRKVDPRIIVSEQIKATSAALTISNQQLETQLMASGRLSVVIDALIEAKRRHVELSWEDACALDLAGKDVLKAAKSARKNQLPCPPACPDASNPS